MKKWWAAALCAWKQIFGSNFINFSFYFHKFEGFRTSTTTASSDLNNNTWQILESDWEGWRETRSSLWKWSTIKSVGNIRQSQFHFLLDQQTHKSTVTAEVERDFSFFVNSSCGLSLRVSAKTETQTTEKNVSFDNHISPEWHSTISRLCVTIHHQSDPSATSA